MTLEENIAWWVGWLLAAVPTMALARWIINGGKPKTRRRAG